MIDDHVTTTAKLSATVADRNQWAENVLADSALLPAARVLGALLALKYVNGASGIAFPSQETLAGIISGSDRNVRRLIGALVSAGYIRVDRRGLGQTNTYSLAFPDRTSSSGPERTPMSGQDRRSVSGQDRRSVSGPNKRNIGELTSERERARAWPPDAVVPEKWIADGAAYLDAAKLPGIDLRIEALKFQNYFGSRSDAKARRTEAGWKRSWFNWILKTAQDAKGGSNGRVRQSGSGQRAELEAYARELASGAAGSGARGAVDGG